MDELRANIKKMLEDAFLSRNLLSVTATDKGVAIIYRDRVNRSSAQTTTFLSSRRKSIQDAMDVSYKDKFRVKREVKMTTTSDGFSFTFEIVESREARRNK